jgi:hypothetical protein
MTTAVVVAHYNENLDWLKNIQTKHKVFIYSKTNQNYNFIPLNKGQEATCYLKYIIDNYNNLYDRNLFLHGHENSNHQDNCSWFIVNNLNWLLSEYFSVTRRDWYFTEGINENFHIDTFNMLKKYWSEVFQNILLFPKTFHHYSCAQFQVSKQLILQNSLNFYKSLYNWLMETQLENYYSGRIFEHTWHYIFTKKSIEPIQEFIYNR